MFIRPKQQALPLLPTVVRPFKVSYDRHLMLEGGNFRDGRCDNILMMNGC